MSKKPDLIFSCRKCEHEVYVDKKKVHELLTYECPECGEEYGRLWTLRDEGNFKDL